MIEQIMYLGIGFFFGALIGLLVVPLVHRRAMRLTMSAAGSAISPVNAGNSGDKDKLRADLAMSTRRLETSVEAIKTKSAGQAAELKRTADPIGRLKAELGGNKIHDIRT